MNRYEYVKSLSVEEMAREIIELNFTDEYCKSTCDSDTYGCVPRLELECCVKWLSEPLPELFIQTKSLEKENKKLRVALDKASQILQDNGFEEESKAIDCMAEL